MTFSMKPQTATLGGGEGSNVSNEQWQEWNTYLHELIGTTEVPVQGKKGAFERSKSYVGILNFIMDMGFQPQPDAKYDTKCALPEEGEEYSDEEKDHMDNYPTNDFIWVEENGAKKRKQTAPVNPEQEYAFFFDFPEIVVDYTKHPIEELHALGKKPLRVSYNGKFKKGDVINFGSRLPFRLDFRNGNTLSVKNPINKIASKMGVAQDFASSEYDLGVLAGQACKWTVVSEKRVVNDKTFYNTKIKDAAAIEEVSAGGVTITREQQIPECDVPFVGVMFDADEYDQDTIEYIKKRPELIAVVQRATSFKPSPVKHPDFVLGKDFKDSKLAVALGLVGGEDKTEAPKTETKDPEPKVEAPAAAFDDDIPFIQYMKAWA